MPRARFSANANYEIEADASLQYQDRAGNYSMIYWRITVHKLYGYGHMATTNMGNSGHADSVVGRVWSNGNMAYDFRSPGPWIIADGTFRVDHNAMGQASYYFSASLNYYALGSASATTGWRNLPALATNPPPPRPLGTAALSQTEIQYKFQSQGDGGTPVREWQIGYGRNPSYPEHYVTSWGTSTIGGLLPGTPYYFWSRGRNDIGWSGWSERASNSTIAGFWIKIAGNWIVGVPYIKLDGQWRMVEPWIKVGGVWRRTG